MCHAAPAPRPRLWQVPAGARIRAPVGRCQRRPPGPGEVSEWLKEHAWKVCKRLNRASGVRIPLSPPDTKSEGPRKGAFFVSGGERGPDENPIGFDHPRSGWTRRRSRRPKGKARSAAVNPPLSSFGIARGAVRPVTGAPAHRCRAVPPRSRSSRAPTPGHFASRLHPLGRSRPCNPRPASMAQQRTDRLESASRSRGGRFHRGLPARRNQDPQRSSPMVAPSAPRDARSKIPPGPEGSNGIDRRGRRGQPAGPPPFPALDGYPSGCSQPASPSA